VKEFDKQLSIYLKALGNISSVFCYLVSVWYFFSSSFNILDLDRKCVNSIFCAEGEPINAGYILYQQLPLV